VILYGTITNKPLAFAARRYHRSMRIIGGKSMGEETRSSRAERKPRREVDFEAYVFRSDGSRPLVKVSNVSYDGCQIADGPDFEPAERVTVVLPDRGEAAARVRWSAAGKTGASFERVSRGPETKPIFPRPFFYGSGRQFGKKSQAFG